jgi:hypothetical protein
MFASTRRGQREPSVKVSSDRIAEAYRLRGLV